MKKARRWLDDHGVAYDFHDYKKLGIDAASVKRWVAEAGLDVVLNKRGTTWRKLPDDVKTQVKETSAIDLMVENPSMIKRPIIEYGKTLLVGFDAEQYRVLFD